MLMCTTPMTPSIKGIGKTVVSTWLVRHAAVRKRFKNIAWVTLGQTPNMEKLQCLLYVQLTGINIQKDMSEAEREQNLKQAFQGKNVLLVLDDCWEKQHADRLVFIDDTTGSKVLISSRVRGALEGGTVMDVGLPSDIDAVKILLNEAGLDGIRPEDAPSEAMAVVKFCNNLPLAIGMAGGILKTMSLGTDGDWSGVVAVLKDEFGEGGQSRGMENSIIRTSLKSIKGTQQAEVVQLFHAFVRKYPTSI